MARAGAYFLKMIAAMVQRPSLQAIAPPFVSCPLLPDFAACLAILRTCAKRLADMVLPPVRLSDTHHHGANDHKPYRTRRFLLPPHRVPCEAPPTGRPWALYLLRRSRQRPCWIDTSPTCPLP